MLIQPRPRISDHVGGMLCCSESELEDGALVVNDLRFYLCNANMNQTVLFTVMLVMLKVDFTKIELLSYPGNDKRDSYWLCIYIVYIAV